MGNEIIFVDFDNTVFVWKNMKSFTEEERISQHLTGTMDYNAYGHINSNLEKHLLKWKQCTHDKIILLSHVSSSVELECKKDYLNKECPGLFDDFIAVGDAPTKIIVMKGYAMAYNKNKKDVILIDDLLRTVRAAQEEGFTALHITEVMADGIAIPT